MTSEIAVYDACPLIAFHQVDRLELLHGLFVQADVPPAVAQEVAPSLGKLPHWVRVQPVLTFPSFSRMLGSGERAAIALAISLSADFIASDDLRARTSASELGLTVIGSLGLLVRAKGRGLIGEVRPVMDQMVANGLFVSDELYCGILLLAEENG